ncbi:MAG: hypothetical protein AAFO61_04115 [Pseudomonadota bacterium]
MQNMQTKVVAINAANVKNSPVKLVAEPPVSLPDPATCRVAVVGLG